MFHRLSGINFIGRQHRLLSIAALMFFFFALFDGLLSYLIPIRITDLGYSSSQMGLILASASIFGAIFDFFLVRLIKNTNYRRLFLITYGLCFAFPLLLWPSKGIPLLIICMAVWGLYADLNLFATFDFVSRRSKEDEHCKSFGILGIFRSVGYLIAPIIAGALVISLIDFFPFSLAISFILIALVFYLLLVEFSPKRDSSKYDHHPAYHRLNFLKEFSLLGKIAKLLLPVLLFSTTIFIFDAVFWTIGPIFSESFSDFKDFGGFFMTAYTLPVLIANWFVNPIVKKFGKKRTAYISFLLGSLFLLPICLVTNPVIIIILVFISSLLGAVAWPAIDGAYADYISESHQYDKEIESLTDFTCNLGYIIGPIFAGFMADFVGNRNVFAVLAIFNIAMVIVLLIITPKQIKVVLHRR